MPTFNIKAVDPKTKGVQWMTYDNMTSQLRWADSGQFVTGHVPVERDESACVPTVSVNTPLGKVTPKKLKIALGLSCNYECEYCSQRFVPRAGETNPGEVESFVASLDEWVKEPPTQVEFWGGEPLVYIKTLKPLAERLRIKYPETTFVMITNGSLLTPGINDWLEAMNFSIGLSHDGPGQHVRGPDPLADESTRAAILDLWKRLAPKHRMSFNTMMNRQNVSRAAIQKFFIELTGDPDVRIGEGSFVDAYDAGGVANSLSLDELAPYRNLAFHEIRTGQAANFDLIRERVASFVNAIRTHRPAKLLGQKCGMDNPANLAVDLRGNVLTCQNVSIASVAPNGQSHKIGHVSDLSGVKLNTSTHWSHRDECPKCPVLHICKGSCMFLEGDLWETSCDNAFSDAIPVFAAAIEFLTGLVPVEIQGAHREDRHDIWNRAQPTGKRRTIPITPQQA